jgi:hypothetical protein
MDLSLDDGTGLIETVIFPDVYRKVAVLVATNVRDAGTVEESTGRSR